MKSTAMLSLGLAAAIGLAACGGDDSPETPIVVTDQTATLTKEEFITQADVLCDSVNSQVSDIAEAGEGITRAAEVAALREGLVTDIRDLGTPVDDGSSSSSTSTSSTEPDVSTFPGATGDTTDSTDTAATTDSSAATGTSTAATSTGDPLEDFLTALSAQAAAGEKIDLASQRGETTAEGEADLTAAKDRAATAGTAYGFEICGTDGTTSQDTSTPTIGTDSSDGTSVAPPVTPTPVAPSSDSGGSSDVPSDDGSSDDGSSSGGVGAGGGVGTP